MAASASSLGWCCLALHVYLQYLCLYACMYVLYVCQRVDEACKLFETLNTITCGAGAQAHTYIRSVGTHMTHTQCGHIQSCTGCACTVGGCWLGVL